MALVLIPLVLALRETHNPSNTDWPVTRAALAWDLTAILAWLTGAWLRTRRLYEQSLVEQAAQAEREREQSAHAAIAEERARMARELHDSIAHSLTVIVVLAEAADDALDRDPETARLPVRQIGRTGRDALVEMRQVIGALRGAEAADVPKARGRHGIEELVTSADAAGLSTRLSVTGSPEGVASAVDQAAYRVVQEALTNVLKHSQSGEVSVSVDYGQDVLDVEVANRGPATPPHANGSGHGLVGMRERVTLVGGRIQAGPLPGGGFRVHAAIPAGRAR